ncbi:DUF58 domain-containing protein [Haliea sp. E17]|uniref:DUF58 domain-containing protein n=1 Tax=Haliea sp. E17 TaxID=3401576 RepID=UPI003AB0236A
MQRELIDSPARGAYVELETLIALRFIARQLKLTRRKRALARLAGANQSNFRGRGIDFDEVRAYQPGDDIRSIDWRVTARSGEAHTKLFREERERPVLVVVDQRPDMFFGSRHCFKSVLAAQLAALFAWAALEGGDRVGGLVFDGTRHRDLKPRRSRRSVLALLSEITAYNHALPASGGNNSNGFSSMLSALRRVVRPGSSVYLVSDFRGAESEEAGKHLFQLAQHVQIMAVCCRDTLEEQLPQAGNYAVTDGEQRSQLDTADRRLRQRYQQEEQAGRQQLQAQMARLGIPLLDAHTHESPFRLLQTYFGESRR